MSADYSFYTETYHGTLIPEEDFPFWLGKADARLEELTFGRCFRTDLPAAVQTRVSLAECPSPTRSFPLTPPPPPSPQP